MPSSTSSSERPLPTANWPRILGAAALVLVLCVAYLELRLALRGFRATSVDTRELWIAQRARAAELGPRALILVGASRMQLDMDLPILRAASGLEPVQLAIDASNFMAVFEGLARDPRVTGTLIVDFSDGAVISAGPEGISNDWQHGYERAQGAHLPGFDSVEAQLTRLWRTHLRSYADGAQPLTSLTTRILPARATQQYLVTLPDRSRLADYSKVPMPESYYGRVIRNLGEDLHFVPGIPFAEVERQLREHVEALQPDLAGLPAFERGITALTDQTRAIEARGGRVYFVELPTSGLVREIDEHRYPRDIFWNRFVATVGTPTLHFEDVPALKALQCPDGSHLDFRQREAFTRTFAGALGLSRAAG